MDKAEQAQLAEIERTKAAIKKTSSPYLVKDYIKHLRELEKDLADYRMFKEGVRYAAR